MQDRTRTLRIHRAMLGLTQIQTARKAGMHFQRYGRIENGVYDPTPVETKAIAKALRAKPADLFPELVEAAR